MNKEELDLVYFRLRERLRTTCTVGDTQCENDLTHSRCSCSIVKLQTRLRRMKCRFIRTCRAERRSLVMVDEPPRVLGLNASIWPLRRA